MALKQAIGDVVIPKVGKLVHHSYCRLYFSRDPVIVCLDRFYHMVRCFGPEIIWNKIKVEGYSVSSLRISLNCPIVLNVRFDKGIFNIVC